MRHRKKHLPAWALALALALTIVAAPSTAAIDPRIPPGPGAHVESVAPSTLHPGGVEVGPAYYGIVQAAPVASSPVVEVRGGLDWADAGIGAGIALGSILLLCGALLVRRAGQRHRLATN
jgi:hypothetical protein